MDSENELINLREEHTPAAIRDRLQSGAVHSYLKDFIYGAIDGTVTTFAVVAGVAGADLAAGITIVLGFANLIADGFSMAVSNLLATRADQQMRDRARLIEESHIKVVPEGEREEIRQILAKKGFTGKDLERGVDVITSDVNRWVDMMMQDELGLPLEGPSPWRAAATTFIAFVVVGVVPLLTFVIQMTVPAAKFSTFAWSIVLTCVTFFAIGAIKSRFTETSKWYGGMETLLVGGIAAALAYVVGVLLRGLSGV